MSGIIIMGPIFAAMVAGAIVLAAASTARYFGKFPMNRVASLSLGAVLFFVFLWPITQWCAGASTTTRIAMNPRDGEKRLEFVGLPSNTTSDFCFRSSLVGVTILADFQMSEEDFLRWMISQGWNAVPFQIEDDEPMIQLPDGTYMEVTVYPVRDYKSGKQTTVHRGYCCLTPGKDISDNTKKIIYDLNSGRAYFEYHNY